MSWDEEGAFADWRGREVRVKLVPFRPDHAPRILEWPQTDVELASWASLTERPGPEVFAGWLAAEDVEGYVLAGEDGEPVAYGELWISIEEDEVELGRLLVAPAHRRRGVGRRLVTRLLEIARRHHVSSAWVRVVESNGPALACYRSAGFQPVSGEEEHALNAQQPRAYRWLRLALRGTTGSDTRADGERGRDWSAYYDHHRGRSPRPLFLRALERFAADPEPAAGGSAPGSPPRVRRAIDLGAGDGTETLHLLREGWHVLAVDAEADSIARIRAGADASWPGVLECRVATLESLPLPPADFVFAGFSLPFCTPDAFPGLWGAIVEALPRGGRFAGHLFGERDSWASDPAMTVHTSTEVATLLDAFLVEHHDESAWDGEAFSGPKHWHLHEIIAVKR